ncbi:AraC family transcriptional regulator [Paenibacillus sp. 32O-W]|uniref:helix-turn-helix transcriptional regulator n=1 Tax=Paenibacillus sp. 32O-W TaxID=1695218 RepID=UPI0007219D1F|nr:helix-turn-helix domain-containing protein [Paenibacillus sp. 32O-W]ALS28105.1 AraC family transcriptional regulator [Paenibacillus sp. 32O-W]
MPKYLVRLFVFTLLLVAVPVVATGTISYFIAKQDIEKKVNEGNEQILLQNKMRIEQVFKNVEMGAVQYINSPLAASLYDRALTADDFQSITALSKGLYNLHSIAGVSDTYLINLEHDWMISELGFTHTGNFPDRDRLSEYALQGKKLFWLATDANRADQPADERSDPYQIRLIVKLPMIASSSQPKAVLIVDLSYSELQQDLTQNTEWRNIYVLNREREPFLSSPGSPKIDEAVLTKLEADAETEAGYFEEQGQAVNVLRSDHHNWTYVSIVSIQEITKQSRKIAFVTVNACLIIFSVIAVFAYFGSRRMYEPIRRMFAIMQQFGGESDDAGKKDEFAYIEERLHILFSARKQLQQQLQGQRGQIKEFFLHKLFMGQMSESEFIYKSGVYGFTDKSASLAVLALQIDTLQDTRYTEKDKELLLFAIHNIIGELIPPRNLIGSLLLDQSQVSLITSDAGSPDELKALCHQLAGQVQRKVRELLQLQVSIGISRAFYRYAGTMNAYSEALEALKRRISLGYHVIVSYDDIESASASSIRPDASWSYLENSLIQALQTGDEASTFEHFDGYVESIMGQGVQFNDFQILMLELIARVYRLVQQQGGALDSLLGTNSAVQQFLKLNTAADIVSWFKTKLFPPTLSFLKEQIDSQYIGIARQMVQMIHDAYDQDITLEACSEKLKFHPVYLSRVFKKEVGVTFSEYLTEYRINMAKLWLKDGTMKINEIAERLSYTNATGFIRTFRKMTGMTPGQYREEHSKSS